MRLAAIDVGTNTVLLLVADVDGDTLRVVADQERFARLGQDVDATGRLAPEAMDRVVARLRECRAVARELGAERIVLGATSASRDASNTDELVQRVRRELGIDYRVIDGDQEAALSFRGAMAMLRPVPAEAVVVDVGGGSTEVVGGAAGSRQPSRVSLDVGSVRLTERHLRRLPAGADAVAAAMADAAAALSRVPDDLVIAYEPVWAIGTGRTARGSDAAQMAQVIRRELAEHGVPNEAQGIPVLYGGSVTSSSIEEFLAEPDIDGALVGGASLKVDEMAGIVARAGLTAVGRGFA